MANPKIITPPAAEAITLDEARLHLRLDAYDSPPTHPDDPLIQGMIAAAREWAQHFTGRSILDQVLELGLDAFPSTTYAGIVPWVQVAAPCTMALPGPFSTVPIQLLGAPITELISVTYTDGTGVDQPLTTFQFDTFQEPPRLAPAPGASWPMTQVGRLGAVRVRYRAGYTLPDESPSGEPLPIAIKQAMLLVLGHLYENREDSIDVLLSSIPLGAQALLRPYRLETGMG